MKFLEIKKYLEKLIVFTTNDLKKIDDNFNKRKIFLWWKKFYFKQVRRWVYILSDINLNENILFLIANKAYFPSYISLETALSFYWIIPETVYEITSISSKKTFSFEFENINFTYKTLSSKYFFWYDVINFWNRNFLIWELEKVILDFLYFRKNITWIEDFEELRFNKIELKNKLNFKKLQEYAKIFNKKVLDKKINILIDYINKW